MKTYDTDINVHDKIRFEYFICCIGMKDAIVTTRKVPIYGGYTDNVSFQIADEREYDLLIFKLRRGYTVEEAFKKWIHGQLYIQDIDNKE